MRFRILFILNNLNEDTNSFFFQSFVSYGFTYCGINLRLSLVQNGKFTRKEKNFEYFDGLIP